MFGFFKARREIKEHYALLVQFLRMISYGFEELGAKSAFNLLRNSKMIAECNDQSIAGRMVRNFNLKAPMNEFYGNLEEDADGSLNLAVFGKDRYQGFLVVFPSLSSRLVVSATNGIATKATGRAVALKSYFVADGALDNTRLLEGSF